jgi:hypothetical protein
MANISGYIEIANGTASSNRCYASVVSNNFSQIAVAVNSNALNSENYSRSALYGSHVADSQIQSYHLAQNQIPAHMISVGAIVESHMNYASSASGVRVLRVGGVASKMPASGAQIARYVIPHTYTSYDSNVMAAATDPVRNQITVVFSEAYGGIPAFSSAPYFLAEPVVSFTTNVTSDTALFNADNCGVCQVLIKNLGAVSCEMEFVYRLSNTNTHAANVVFAVIGDKNG